MWPPNSMAPVEICRVKQGTHPIIVTQSVLPTRKRGDGDEEDGVVGYLRQHLV